MVRMKISPGDFWSPQEGESPRLLTLGSTELCGERATGSASLKAFLCFMHQHSAAFCCGLLNDDYLREFLDFHSAEER